MKNKLLKILTAVCCIPILVLCGCSSVNSKLDTINASTYFNSAVACTTYGKTTQTSGSLSDLLAEKPNLGTIGQYTKFELKANSAWIYKMYIDYIYFYVYTNIDVESQMTINIEMTNLAKENDIENPDTFQADCSLIPKKDGKILCEVKVQRVVATATGSTLTFDILGCPEVFADDKGVANGFKWTIYGLEFYAESRTYSKA